MRETRDDRSTEYPRPACTMCLVRPEKRVAQSLLLSSQGLNHVGLQMSCKSAVWMQELRNADLRKCELGVSIF